VSPARGEVRARRYVSIVADSTGLPAIVADSTFRRDRYIVQCELTDGSRLVVGSRTKLAAGDPIRLEIDATGVVAL